jgi:hypothetical protein
MKEKVTVYKLIDFAGCHPMINGTINDIRQFAKNLWKQSEDFIQHVMFDKFNGKLIEEDFYTKMDDDLVLFAFLEGAGYDVKPLCEVPLDDFYDEQKPKQELIDEVLEQIKKDITEGDLTALDEMLKAMPIEKLIGYLPEK